MGGPTSFVELMERMEQGEVFLANSPMGGVPSEALARLVSEEPGKVIRILEKHEQAGLDVLYAPTFGFHIDYLHDSALVEQSIRGAISITTGTGFEGPILASIGPSPNFWKVYPNLIGMFQDFQEGAPRLAAAKENLVQRLIDPPRQIPDDVKGSLDHYISSMRLMVDEGVTAIHFPTVTSVLEAEIAYAAYQKLETKVPLIISFNVVRHRDGYYTTLWGEKLIEAYTYFDDAVGLGVNCLHPVYAHNAIKTLKDPPAEGKFLVAFPSARNLPEEVDGRTSLNPSDMATALMDSVRSGATLVGVCCGSNPKYTEAIRKKIDDYNARKD